MSHEALRKIKEQRKLLSRRNPLPPLICTGSFTRSKVPSCLHVHKALQGGGQVLSLEHFTHTGICGATEFPKSLLEPQQQIESTFLATNIPRQSSRREPSSFETVEVMAKVLLTCSRCHAVGHTRTSRVCLMRFEELLQQGTATPESRLQSVALSNPDLKLDQNMHSVETQDGD